MDAPKTETDAKLERLPPEKEAPAADRAFTLVLVDVCSDNRQSLIEAVCRAAGASPAEAERLLARRLPVCVKQGLTYTDGQIAQFELLCGDAISVIVPDEVVATAPAEYLAELYTDLRNIDEFQPVAVCIHVLPDDANGQAFCDRFLNGRRPDLPATAVSLRKKARLMQCWADKIGGRVTVVRIAR